MIFYFLLFLPLSWTSPINFLLYFSTDTFFLFRNFLDQKIVSLWRENQRKPYKTIGTIQNWPIFTTLFILHKDIKAFWMNTKWSGILTDLLYLHNKDDFKTVGSIYSHRLDSKSPSAGPCSRLRASDITTMISIP